MLSWTQGYFLKYHLLVKRGHGKIHYNYKCRFSWEHNLLMLDFQLPCLIAEVYISILVSHVNYSTYV
jgi:hypothetical protein